MRHANRRSRCRVASLLVAPPPNIDCDDLRAACHSYERQLLEAALARCRFNQRATAIALKLTYDQLRHALRRHDLLEKTAN